MSSRSRCNFSWTARDMETAFIENAKSQRVSICRSISTCLLLATYYCHAGEVELRQRDERVKVHRQGPSGPYANVPLSFERVFWLTFKNGLDASPSSMPMFRSLLRPPPKSPGSNTVAGGLVESRGGRAMKSHTDIGLFRLCLKLYFMSTL